MKLEVIDKETRSKVEMIRTYDYVQYIDEFIGEGRFQINLPVSDVSMPYLVRNNYIVFEEGIVGIIKNIKDSQDENMQIVVSGKLTNSVLSIRSILKTERYSGTLSEVSRSLVQRHFMFPENEKRKVDIITLATDAKYNPSSENIKFCDTGNDIRKSIATTFAPHGYGFELYPILTDYDEASGITANLSALEFRVLKPVDRTIGNKDGNTPVVFSFQFSNLARLEYEEDGSTYCSVAVVASEGTGQDRKVLEVGSLEETGIDRIELYVDARDINSTDENGDAISEDEVLALMEQRGLEKLEGHKVFTSFDGNVIVSGNNRYEYGVDFYKGDYVSIIDDKFNRVYNLQITSVTKSISQGVEYFDIGFGLDKVTTNKLIDTSTSKVVSGGGGGGSSSGGNAPAGEATTVTVKVNNVTTGAPGSNATVTNVGDDVNVRLNFSIPQGATGATGPQGPQGATGATGPQGAKGDKGDKGNNGKAATIKIGTVTSIEEGQTPKVTNTGTDNEAVLNFELPKGPAGDGAEEIMVLLGGFSFGYTDDGKPGFREAGADTVTPFSKPGSSGGSGGSGRTITFSTIERNGLTFCVVPNRFADGSFDNPKTFNRSQRTITSATIIL